MRFEPKTVAALLQAINDANANDEADVINLAPGLAYIIDEVDNTTDGANGLPSISSEIAINGNGAVIKRKGAAQPFRILHVGGTGKLILSGLGIRGGSTTEDGGGIYSRGELTLRGCEVSDNYAAGNGGGIFCMRGVLSVKFSTLTENEAGDSGGAVYCNTAVHGEINNCRIEENEGTTSVHNAQALPTKLVALMGNGHVARATSYVHPAAPNWEDVTGDMDGTCTAGGYLYQDLWAPGRYWCSNSEGLWVCENLWAATPAWTRVSCDDRLKNCRKLIQSIRQEGWMAAYYRAGSYGGGHVVVSEDNFASDPSLVPYPSGLVYYTDMTVAQGGRATGPGSGVQFYLLGRPDVTPDMFIVYSGDGGATVTKRAKPGDNHDAFNPLITHSFTVPVFRNDGSWNTDGDLLYVSVHGNEVKKSEDGGWTFTTFHPDRSLKGIDGAAGAMIDNRHLAWVLFTGPSNDRRIFFSPDYGATWAHPDDSDVNASMIRFDDPWGGVNGYSHHESWFVWWRSTTRYTDTDIFVTDDLGATWASIQGEGVTNIFTATGQSKQGAAAPNVICVMTDPTDLDWGTPQRLNAEHNWWGAADGPSGPGGTGSGDPVSDDVDFAPYLTSDKPAFSGPGACPIAFTNFDSGETLNPISLYLGEKRLEETDLSVTTPAGPLTFTRAFRQGKLNDAQFQFMGMGWTHNHHVTLTQPDGSDPTYTADTLVLYLPGGGEGLFYRESDGYHTAGPGSNAHIDSTPQNEFVVTAPDRSTYTFDSSGKLTARSWPSDETWTYAYDQDGNLESVTDQGYDLDGNGTYRGLFFRYYEGGNHDGQLYRVGDHTFDDADPQNPTGRYVEFAYTTNKVVNNDGDIVDGSGSLLHSVRDVLGNEWDYDHYGANQGETDIRQLNFLVERRSPTMNGSAVTLERLHYVLGAELAVNGGMEAEGDWTDIEGYAPVTNARSTAQVDSGVYSRHVVADAAGEGIEGAPWDLVAGRKYTVTARVYPVSGTVMMQVTGTSAFDDTTGGTGAWETLEAVYEPTGDAEAVRLQFVAVGEPAAFYVDTVSILEEAELAVDGGMEMADGVSPWVGISGYEPQTNTRSTGQVDTGTYARYVVANEAGDGIEGEPWDLVAGRVYAVRARVYPVSGAVRMRVAGQSAFDRTTSGMGAWETVYAVAIPGADGAGVKLQFVAEAGAATFYVDTVTIIESVVTAITQERGEAALTAGFLFRPNGNAVTAATVAGKTTAHCFDRGVHAGSTDPDGNASTRTQNDAYRPALQEDANGNATALFWSANGKHLEAVTDALEHETAFHYNEDDTLDYSLDAEGRKTAYTCGDANNPRLPTQVKVIDTDGTTVLRWQRFSYDGKGRTLTEETLDPADATGDTVLQRTTRTYHPSGDGNGLLHTVTQEDLTDTYNDVTTTYLYDTFGRVVQTNQSSTFGSCTKARTVYDAAGNVVASLCNFEPGTSNPIYPETVEEAQALRQRLYDDQDPDHYTDPNTNRLTIYVYDELGHRVETVNNAEDPYEQAARTVYDALGRVVRAVQGYDPAGVDNNVAQWAWDETDGRWEDKNGVAIPHGDDYSKNLITYTAYNERGMVRMGRDTLGNATLYGYDDAGRLVKTVASASIPGYDNSYGPNGDPELSEYIVGDDPDKDIVTEQVYDAAGNAVKAVDARGRAALTGNDALNRPVKAVRSASQPDYDVRADLDLSAYEASDAPDADLVAVTVYDAMGRAIRNRDAAGSWTLYGYDALGRQVKVVRSASDPEYDITSDPDLSAYDASDDPDRDLVTLTAYDDHGRTRFVADEAGAQTWYVYDGFGRQVLVVQNYYDDGNIDENPDNWVWDATQGRWEDKDGVAIPPGEDHDRNIISQTVYDDDGRVQHTRDALGRVTWNVYDGAGRQVRAVRNYDPTGLTYADPADWVWVTDHWEDGDGHTVVRGDNDGLNLITETTYDDQGRVYTATDARRNLTRSVYDALGRRVRTIQNWVDNGEDPADWVWDENDARWEESNGTPIDHGTDHDRNLVSDTAYDLGGRVSQTRDAAGMETRYEYDAAGRRVQTIANYVDGVFGDGNPDEDVTTETIYDKAGQVVATIDARGTKTAFTYDAAGRRLTVTQAADTPLAAVSYTCYDKGGRVLRTITNWIEVEGAPSPDERNEDGDWLFAPETHGPFEDRDLVTAYAYDAAGRRTLAVQNVYFDGVIDTDLGNWVWSETNARWEDGSGHLIPATAHGDRNIVTQTVYDKAGQVVSGRDPMGVVTRFVYDGLRRLRRVVQNWVDNGEDPAEWVWDANDARWEESDGTPIDHGDDSDRNVTVVVALDLAGQRESLRDPRGKVTTYAYDMLGRRTALTDPLDETWATAYSDLAGGTRAELTDPKGDVTRRDTDRVGRLKHIGYLDEDPKLTPDVEFVYDLAGNRVRMTESDGCETEYAYDALRRLVAVTFDDGQTEQTVQYAYDAGGLRTRLTLPDGLTVTYTYDARGQLVSLTDWDRQTTRFAHDLAGRLIAATRASGLRSRYAYDGAGRLRLLRHSAGRKTLGYFAFDVDARGNRTRAFECVPHPGTGQTVIAYDDDAIAYRGTWADDDPYKVTTEATASLQVMCFGGAEDHLTLTLGTGPDHGICDVFVGNSFWQSFDLYSAAPDDQDEEIPVTGEGPHLIEVRNRAEKDTRSTGYKLRFKGLAVDRTYDLHTIEYAYDALARLLSADYRPGANLGAIPFRQYEYAYDLAGNRTQQIVTVGGTPATTNYTYNAANQLTSDGTNTYTYDTNGNLLGDGVNPYTWDRANRLLSFGEVSYKYDGLGNRVEQTVNSIVAKYLLDTQPGLAVVLESATSSDVTRFVHGPRGLHAQQQPNGDWVFPIQDALGSVRGMADESMNMLESRLYAPYGAPFGVQGSQQTVYGFTGEPADANELVYLRARYLNPGLGVFARLDHLESNNRYIYVSGNPINVIDPSGMLNEDPGDGCTSPYVREHDPCELYICDSNIYKNCRAEKGLHPCPPCPIDYPIGDDDCYCYQSILDYYDAFTLYGINHLEAWRKCESFLAGSLAEERCQLIRRRAYSISEMMHDPRNVRRGNTHIYSDVDALVDLIDYAASFPGTTPQIISDDLSCALLGGPEVRGGLTIMTSLVPALTRKEETAWDWFLDTGFHPHYRDGGNQINHFWAYVNTTAQGGKFGAYVGVAGDLVHEVLGIPDAFEGGATIQDQRLAYLGLFLGLGINIGAIPREYMGFVFRTFLTSPWPFRADPSNPNAWPWMRVCNFLGRDCSADSRDPNRGSPGSVGDWFRDLIR